MSVDSQYVKLMFILLSCFVCVNAFRECKDTFCARIRNFVGSPGDIVLDADSWKLDNTSVKADLLIKKPKSLKLQFTLEVVESSIFHVLIEEPSSTRFRPTEALVQNFRPLDILPFKNDTTLITVIHKDIKAIIHSTPFKVEFYNKDQLVSVINKNSRLLFETANQESAVALDITFPGNTHAYGIPLHTEDLALRDTQNGEPYRLYNVGYDDRFEPTKAHHGSVPVIYGHSTDKSSGIFWLNAAQTWVDVTNKSNQIDTYFMSEAGVIEMFVMTGPTLSEAVIQYSQLTGVAPLPPFFALGYHQSRPSWSQYDVAHVSSKFVSSNLPLDAIWLDASYTDNKKYFTWNPDTYPDPHKLLSELDSNGQKLVAVINPHVKVDNSYDVHMEAERYGYYIKNSNGGSYQAESLPGLSSWLDFLNPYAYDFYVSLFRRFKSFEHSNVHIFNDMNEPLTSHRYEESIPPDSLHFQGVTHREMHNIYGFYQTRATHTAMMNKEYRVRPFIFTKSHFAGTQRYAAVWTGNETPYWGDIKTRIAQCLTEALAGISFCGVDVGGHSSVDNTEMYVRWYQAGAWLPLFRGHYDLTLPPREPYLQNKDVQQRIRLALRQRYAHISLWYLLFRQHERTGEPVIRPITYHYPNEKEALNIDDQFLVGPNVLVAPVYNRRDGEWRLTYLPGGQSQIWYNINDNYNISYGTGYQSIPEYSESIPVFYRGGSIIQRKDTVHSSTKMLCSDYYTIYIAPDQNGRADGTFYSDDCDYFRYKSNYNVYGTMRFSGNMLTFRSSNSGFYKAEQGIAKIVLLNPQEGIKRATLHHSVTNEEAVVNVRYSSDGRYLEATFGELGFSPKIEVLNFEITFSSGVSFKLSVWLAVIVIIKFVLI